ncbi:MAG: DUF362 domain-containing protein [Desulfosudaceae bacterium]
MSRPDWLLSVIKTLFPRKPEYGRLSRLPGMGWLFEKLFFDGDHLITLPRGRTIAIGQPVDPGRQMVLPLKLMDYFIDRMEDHFIMDFCVCRRSMNCADYPVDLGCLFMGEATRNINPDWGRPVSKEEARAHIRRCEEHGLIHFIGKSKLDTQWLGIGPGEKLLTICNCCPCCCITRSLPYAALNLSEKLVRAPGVTVQVGDNCLGCGHCVDSHICFANAISMEADRAVISDDCRGCGRCVSACPAEAIHLSIDPEVFLETSIASLESIIDLPGT